MLAFANSSRLVVVGSAFTWAGWTGSDGFCRDTMGGRGLGGFLHGDYGTRQPTI
jgi:hypothetical protein